MQNIADSTIREQLSTRERLMWSGQPRQGFVFQLADLFVIPFIVGWNGAAILAMIAEIEKGSNIYGLLWGAPFILMGMYLAFARFVLDAKKRKNTYYGVTSERIIIVSGILSQKIKSVNLSTLSAVTLDEYKNGRGSITFGPIKASIWRRNRGFGRNQLPDVPTFDQIADAKKVYEIVRRAQNVRNF